MLYFTNNSWKKCHIISPLLVLSLMGSNLYFIASSWNLLLNLKNPFRSETAYVSLSHFIVWGVSLTLLWYTYYVDISEYRCDYEICWIKTYTSLNPYLWTFLYMPIIVGISYAFYVLFEMHQRLRDGLSDTLAFRKDFLKESGLYTFTYSVYWSLAGVSYIYVFWSPNNGTGMYMWLGILISLVGIVDAIVWLFKFTRNVTHRENVNLVLRKEVLEHTMYGIHTCVLEARRNRKMYGSYGRPSDVMYVKDMNENPKLTTAINRVRSVLPGQKQSKRDTYIYDFAPQVFRYIREDVCGLSDNSYAQSFHTLDRLESMAKEQYSSSEGKSGSFFYFTCDSRFIVKTITYKEAKFLHKILKKYVEFISRHPGSLISRILGMHSLHLYDLTLYFVVMENIFVADLHPHEKYDIKGSWVDRGTSYKVSQGKVMKDNDLHMKRTRGLVILSEEQTDNLLEQLDEDSKFLASLNIMDYSLLVGIYYIKIVSKENRGVRHVSSSMHRCNSGSCLKIPTPHKNIVIDKYGTSVTSFKTKIGRSFAGLKPDHGYQKLNDQVVMIKTTIDRIWNENGGELSNDVEFLSDLDRKTMEELERLKNIYKKLMEEITPVSVRDYVTSMAMSYNSPRNAILMSASEGASSNITESCAPSDSSRELRKSTNPWSDYSGGVQARVTEGPGIYYLGLIDMLQEWDFWKRGERLLKTFFLRKDPDGLSAIDPYRYQKRFMDRMHEIIRDEQKFLKSNNVDEVQFKQNSFEVHIWPTLQKVQDNLEEALKCRTSSNRELRSPKGENQRLRMMSSPSNRSPRPKLGMIMNNGYQLMPAASLDSLQAHNNNIENSIEIEQTDLSRPLSNNFVL